MISPEELTNLSLEIGLLKKIQRTGWVLKGVKDVESVAEHTWRVAMLALMFAPQLKLDPLKMVKMALIHDLGEIGIGDIKWESGKKVIGSQKKKHQDERQVLKKMFADNPKFQEYFRLWEEFNAGRTKEAKIIKQLDKLEMAIQSLESLEYEKEGYPANWFKEFWDNAEKYLAGQELEKYFNYLRKQTNKKNNPDRS
ncbi:MAG: HD domain-containing protein [Candidatus Shapirobacteria bacterium]